MAGLQPSPPWVFGGMRGLGREVEVLDGLNQGDDRPQQLSNLVDRRLGPLFLKAKVFFIFGHNHHPNQELKINREGLALIALPSISTSVKSLLQVGFRDCED
jgi:hypothetical protein